MFWPILSIGLLTYCMGICPQQQLCLTDLVQPTCLTSLPWGISYLSPQCLNASTSRCLCVSEHKSATWSAFPSFTVILRMILQRIPRACGKPQSLWARQAKGGPWRKKMFTVNWINHLTTSELVLHTTYIQYLCQSEIMLLFLPTVWMVKLNVEWGLLSTFIWIPSYLLIAYNRLLYMGKHLNYTIICKNHRYLTQARVAIQQCKNSNYNSCIQNLTQVGVQGWYQQNVHENIKSQSRVY